MHTSSLRQAGVTLIELMLSLTLGLFLIAGALQLLAHSHSTLRLNESAARLQEKARYVFAVIEPDIRMAGFRGLQSAGPIDLTGAAAPAGDCGTNWTIALDRPAEAANNGYTLTCPAYGSAMPGADVLTIRRASSLASAPLRNTLAIHSTRTGPAILPAATDPPASAPAGPSEIRELLVNGYYVSRNSSLDEPGVPVPSLRRKFLRNGGSGPRITDEEILPGVEDLQVQFGIDTDAAGSPARGAVNRYVNPDDPLLDRTSTGYSPDTRVLAVRIWLRVRADARESGLPAMPGWRYADQVVAPINDGYRRIVISRTVFLRNAG